MLNNSNELTAWDRDHFFHPSTHMGMHARGETPYAYWKVVKAFTSLM